MTAGPQIGHFGIWTVEWPFGDIGQDRSWELPAGWTSRIPYAGT
jgi:hypothetical protein